MKEEEEKMFETKEEKELRTQKELTEKYDKDIFRRVFAYST